MGVHGRVDRDSASSLGLQNNMSTLQTDITRLLGMKVNSIVRMNMSVLKRHFQTSKLQLCSLQWAGRAEVYLPAKFLSPVASGSCHHIQVRHVLCRQR